MMSWQAWSPPEDWPIGAPSVRCQGQRLASGHEACLWLFNLDDLTADTPALTDCLSEEEKSRALRFRQALHGRRHRVARAMVRHLLGHLSQRRANELAWCAGPHGKPSLLDPHLGPHEAPTPRFNLSHSGGWALLATSATLELGVDIEERSGREHLREMAHRVLSLEERQQSVTATSALDPTDALLGTWTRKEACLKALGTGLSREMETLTLEGSRARTAREHLATFGPLPPLTWSDLALPQDCPARAAWAWLAPGFQACSE